MTLLSSKEKKLGVRLLTGVLLSTIAVFAPPAFANDSVAVKTLIDQARFWEGKGRGDLAVAAWKRLLQIDPKNPDALAGLAQFELDNNRLDSARALTDELKRQPQANRDAVRRLEGGAAQKTVNTKLLDQARAAAKAGRADEAVSLYKQIFEARPVVGPLALEYYQTLGGTTNGWEEARRGLEKLRAEESENLSVALAYGQHLTYRAATRREGIRVLADLARKPQVSRPALEGWRKALIWLDAGKADVSLYQAFLAVDPNDAAIKARVSGLAQAFSPKPLDARSIALRDAFAALNVGDVGDAEKRFEGLLAAGPRNPDALGGLGVVRLKQERFAEADRLLSDALRISGSKKWEEALGSARFWQSLDDGDAAAAAGDIAAARRFYERAAQIDRKNERPPSALADLLTQEGRLLDAERAYREVLAANPKSINARRGLAGVLVRSGKVDEALQLAEGLTDDEREDLGYGSLKAEQYRRAGIQLIARSDVVGAMQQFEEALLWDANSPWLRLDLARLYHRSGATSEAFGLMDGLLQTSPEMPDALHAAALMSAEAKEYSLGLAMLEKIPANSRTREMMELQRKLWVRAQVGKAEVLSRMGQKAQTAQVLDQALAAAGRDADLLAAIAQVMLELGDEPKSLTMMRNLLALSPKPETDLLVQYAGLLLKSRQDVELAAQLRQLYALQLTPAQRSDVDAIRWAYSVRQTDVQREAGNYSAAYEIAAQLLSEKPNDISAQQALARLYTSAGEHTQALSWYHQVLTQTEPDVPTLVAASGAALAAGELGYAQSALDVASRMSPSDPSVLSAQGRLARAQGKSKQAVALLQQAQQVTLVQNQVQRTGPLGVTLVDYSLPVKPSTAHQKVGAEAVPPIPNPLGVKPALPAAPVPGKPLRPNQPWLQPVSKSSVAGEPAALASVVVAESQRIHGPQQGDDTSSYNDAPPPREGMRTVQYVTQRPQFERYMEPRFGASPDYPKGATGNPGSVFAPAGIGGTPPVLMPVTGNPPASAPLSDGVRPPVPYLAPLQVPPSQFLPAEDNQKAATGFRDSWDKPAVVQAPVAQPRRVQGPGSLQREIDELRADRSGWLGGGSLWRGRNGDPGTSELTDFSTTVEGRFALGESGHLVLRLEPVFLSAGRVNALDFNSSQQFGSNALANVTGGVGTTRDQQDSGVGMTVGFETVRLKLDAGVTPLGFKVLNVVGGLAYNDTFGDMKLKLDVSRRAVTDSLLSYAGTVDDVTGRTWGGVTATGGRVELGVEQGAFGLYGYGGAHVLTGKNVVSNSKFEIGGGAYYKLVQDSDMEVTAGFSVTALGYKRNLRYFTLGHGGYFSPQRYFSIALPLEMAGRTGRVSYRLDGSIGIQNFRENSTAYYPGDDAQQANWETVAAANAVAAPANVTWRAFYPSQSKTGLGFRLGGEAEYQFSPQWSVGGKMSIDNASNYMQTSGLLYLRYSFDPIYTPARFPPRMMKVGQ